MGRAQVMCNKDVKFAPDGRPLEAALAETLDHPGIVRTVATAVTGNGPTDPSGETWLVMELCNGGDLQVRGCTFRCLHVESHVGELRKRCSGNAT